MKGFAAMTLRSQGMPMNKRTSARVARRRGAVLLEVVLALTIFVVAAAVILNALSASVRGVRQLDLDATASDLAVTVLSRLEIGDLPAQSSGPSPFDEPDRADWTWQVVVNSSGGSSELSSSSGAAGISQVEIVIRNESQGVVRRLGGSIFENTGGATDAQTITNDVAPVVSDPVIGDTNNNVREESP